MTHRPELEALLQRARDWYKNASQEEIDAMIAKQREGYVRAEMSWPKAKYKWVDGVKVYESYEDYCND
jgi:uncharacterized protein YdaT